MAELLAFAERVLTDLGALWKRLEPKGRRALQATVFPAGVTFDGETFGTPQIASVFLHLRAVSAPESDEASPEGFEPS
ncbi:MAG: hypothetical protein K8H88_15470 [Sandaracinaceae bacterium]|nr:hypothetical protein [Sandaracinaceae bacterium]